MNIISLTASSAQRRRVLRSRAVGPVLPSVCRIDLRKSRSRAGIYYKLLGNPYPTYVAAERLYHLLLPAARSDKKLSPRFVKRCHLARAGGCAGR